VTTNNATVAPIKRKNPVKADTTHIFSNVAMMLLRTPSLHEEQEQRALAAEVAVRLPTLGAKIFGGDPERLGGPERF
jgi:hypothetical protein